MGDACNGEQEGWIADGEQREGDLARCPPRTLNSPPTCKATIRRAQNYITSIPFSPLSPLSPLHSRPRPSASNSARCLSVCPSARMPSRDGRRKGKEGGSALELQGSLLELRVQNVEGIGRDERENERVLS